MSGVLLPARGQGATASENLVWARMRAAVWANRVFLALVVLPTLVTALYFGLFAANQYQSSADFIVRRADSAKTGPDVGALLGFSLGSAMTEGDAYVVRDYLLSHNAVARLRKEDNLVGVFTRSRADLLSRLWSDNPSPEKLLKFYLGQVEVREDDDSGISHLTVRTFDPADSHALAQKLLRMGEEQVNAINRRTTVDQVANAQRDYNEASRLLNEIEGQLTAYRQNHADVDPAETGKARGTMVTTLTGNLVTARARLRAMEGAIGTSSPQYRAMARQVQTLEAQVNAQMTQIVGPGQSVATRLGEYEKLVIKRQQVAQVYSVTAGQLKQAEAEARRQKLYLIRVVQPNVPVKSEYPERMKTILTVFATLFLAYAIGWLLWAGVKEHAL